MTTILIRVTTKEVAEYFFVGILLVAVLLPVIVDRIHGRFPDNEFLDSVDGFFWANGDTEGGDFGGFDGGGNGGGE